VALFTVCAAYAGHVHAGDIANDTTPQRPVTSAFMLCGGSLHLADTYLTPLHYDGWMAAISYERSQAMKFNPRQWAMSLGFTVDGGQTRNPARNASMWMLDIEARWRMMRRWQLPAGVALNIGGATTLGGGALYLARNGNNPAAARAAWSVDISARATWRTHISALPVTLGYDAVMPLAGVFFSPDYGQLYYEIYLGDTSGVVRGLWPGNYFRLDNKVYADLHLGGTTLRLGYACDIRSTKTRGIVTRQVSHCAVIGVVCQWLSVPMTSTHINSQPIIEAY